MDEAFGPAAARLAGFCAVAFGWSPDQFWQATPAEVASVVAALMPADEVPATRGLLAQLEKSCG